MAGSAMLRDAGYAIRWLPMAGSLYVTLAIRRARSNDNAIRWL